MPSAQDCAERLREQAYRTLLPQIRDLEQELQSFSSALSAGVQQIGRRLDALRNIELPTTEVVLGEILNEVKLQKDNETGVLVLFARDLRLKETQEEILSLLLDSAQRYFPRIALFAVRGDRFKGWSSRGYSEAQAHSFADSSFSRSECAQLEKALDGQDPVAVSDSPGLPGILHLLQEQDSGPALLIPLRALQRPVALLLASGNGTAPSCRDALCILAELASLRLETIALKILHELSAARPETAPRRPRVEEVAVPSPSPAPEPTPSVAAVPPEPAQAAEQVAAAAAEPQTVQESVEERAVETAPAAAAEEVPSPKEEAPYEMTFQTTPPRETPSIPPQEPYLVGDEEKLHTDAKRFARLLVSEIKLYNEHHVQEGRENRDLYLRLKRDIDRSREMYEKRVSPNVARKTDYFHDEIIRILGDNDPSALGIDYPGPRVES
jgi:hypothetical protein